MLDKTLSVVLYTDGGARPNPGKIGYGAHGYLFKLTDNTAYDQVNGWLITSEGYRKQASSTSKPVEVIEYFDFTGSSREDGTNNLAEISALSISLTHLLEKNPGEIKVYVDSEYLRKGIFEWCKGWTRNNWIRQDGLPVANAESWKRLYSLITEYRSQGGQFSMDWVRSHSDILGNVQADYLAIVGINYSAMDIEVNDFHFKEAKKYWKPEVESHPFFNFKRIYYNSLERYNIVGNYFQGDSGAGDSVIGKRIPETGFAIIQLHTPNPIIELIKKKQYQISGDMNAVIMMKLDRVFSKEVFPYLAKFGDRALLGSKGNLNVNFLDNKPVTVEVNPTGLSLRAIESFNFLEEILELYKKFSEVGFDDPTNNLKVRAHDITSEFYTTETKLQKKEMTVKSVLKTDMKVGMKDYMLDIEEPHNGNLVKIKVPIVLGLDTLPRNNLKRLEPENPKVFLITWRESENSLRYATIVKCDSGIGIWSNFFADRIFL